MCSSDLYAALTSTVLRAGPVLVGALLHAIWNSCAHAIEDRLVGFALTGVAATVGGGALAAAGGLPPAASWPFVLASAATHVAYNLLLMASYQLGECAGTQPGLTVEASRTEDGRRSKLRG